jgi:hypothetical protein
MLEKDILMTWGITWTLKLIGCDQESVGNNEIWQI